MCPEQPKFRVTNQRVTAIRGTYARITERLLTAWFIVTKSTPCDEFHDTL